MKFRRRNDVVTAIRFDGTRGSAEAIALEVPGVEVFGERVDVPVADQTGEETRRVHAVGVGDWVVTTAPNSAPWPADKPRPPTCVIPGSIFRSLFVEDLGRSPAGPEAAPKPMLTLKEVRAVVDAALKKAQVGVLTPKMELAIRKYIDEDPMPAGRPAPAAAPAARGAAVPRQGSRPKPKTKK